jgi:hypothetical protein
MLVQISDPTEPPANYGTISLYTDGDVWLRERTGCFGWGAHSNRSVMSQGNNLTHTHSLRTCPWGRQQIRLANWLAPPAMSYYWQLRAHFVMYHHLPSLLRHLSMESWTLAASKSLGGGHLPVCLLGSGPARGTGICGGCEKCITELDTFTGLLLNWSDLVYLFRIAVYTYWILLLSGVWFCQTFIISLRWIWEALIVGIICKFMLYFVLKWDLFDWCFFMNKLFLSSVVYDDNTCQETCFTINPLESDMLTRPLARHRARLDFVHPHQAWSRHRLKYQNKLSTNYINLGTCWKESHIYGNLVG